MDFPVLQQIGAMDFLSDYGKKIYNPTGIFYWSGRSKNEAKINATIGTAMGKSKTLFADGDETQITLCIPSIHTYFPSLSTEEIFPYAPEAGIPAFREAWKKWLLRKAGASAERLDQQTLLPIVVSGITAGISICTRMFVDPGTPIVVPDKRWENYDNIFERNVGNTIEEFQTFDGQDFNMPGFLQAIQNVWATQDKAVALLNFPNNPTGYCPPKAAATQFVQDIAAFMDANPSKKLVLLFDDAYEGYVYDEESENASLFYQIEPKANLLPVKLDGMSKEMLWYGARIGAITLACPDAWLEKADKAKVESELENKFRGVVRNTISNCNRLAQVAALKAFKNLDQVLAERQTVFNLLAERYRVLKAKLADIDPDLLIADPFQGGFFCFVNINPNTGLNAPDVCDHLLKEYKVGTVPSQRGVMNGIRLAFCGVEVEDIPELCDSMQKAVKDLLK
ncbi:MAG: aminotransferase class I/II-fold pyridoxal phosphate-dependent enzyme [bacterium]|jgi:aspartate/methionine/tyrosine aminotransferase|nr:aminotransferase class I/II-fold pyridoxal phosphate-dependent enzyme [bacterium]